MKKLKVRAIIPDKPGDATVWWRIERPFALLNSRGHDATYHLYDNLEEVDFKDSLVIIHRIIPGDPKKYIKDLRNKGARTIIYSLDDYTIDTIALKEYLVSCGGMTTYSIQQVLDRIPRQIEIMRLCDEVITSTIALAELVYSKVKNSLLVLTNALDLDWYTSHLSKNPLYRGNSFIVYIGWAGGRRPETDLKDMAQAWKRIEQRYDNVRFVVAGWQPDIIDRNISDEKKIRIPWAPLSEWPRSMQVDIGCCPLSRTKFNQGKSPIKYLEYSMSGAAVVASPLIYDKLMINYLTGYLVENEEQWFDSLCELVENKQKRLDLNAAACYEIAGYNSLELKISAWEFQFSRLLER